MIEEHRNKLDQIQKDISSRQECPTGSVDATSHSFGNFVSETQNKPDRPTDSSDRDGSAILSLASMKTIALQLLSAYVLVHLY